MRAAATGAPPTADATAETAGGRPTGEAAAANPARKWITIGLLGAACALVGTFLLGMVVGGSDADEVGTSSPSTSSVASSTTTSALAMADDGVSQSDLDEVAARVDELETREAELDAQVVMLEDELEAVTADAANLAEHNRLLQTWFTADVLARSQAAWDGEVARGCELAETPAVDDLNYIRALEVIGTPDDLLTAVLACRQGDA